jgi:hypothetical protein
MSRKRTPDQPSTDTETQEASVAATANAEPPAAVTPAPAQSFAERVRQERQGPALPDPFCIATDAAAGVRLFESRQDRQMAIKFDDKPGQDVIDLLKEEGYRWNPRDKIWARPVQSSNAMSTRIEAEQLYQEVRSIIRHEKGIEAGPEVPF